MEIEKKYILSNDQRERISETLQTLGAEYQGEDFEENIIYKGGILDEKRAVLRVRKIGDKTILAYKERVSGDAPVKHQKEYETVVEDEQEIRQIIENLGFTKALVYEKRRKNWRLGDVEVVLDELPFGLYMEIEGSLTAISEAEMMLDAEYLEVENETYPHLTQRFGVRKLDYIESRFA